MKIGLTNVFVNNALDAFRFYTETLGFVEKLFVPEAQLPPGRRIRSRYFAQSSAV